mmetsp:Transcript_11482/g.18812  ORF Transcript_11482/g.18812 Transcript_11482/m.18812 type:complete len:210 (-) Transcript_11482:1287-1916(-)
MMMMMMMTTTRCGVMKPSNEWFFFLFFTIVIIIIIIFFFFFFFIIIIRVVHIILVVVILFSNFFSRCITAAAITNMIIIHSRRRRSAITNRLFRTLDWTVAVVLVVGMTTTAVTTIIGRNDIRPATGTAAAGVNEGRVMTTATITATITTTGSSTHTAFMRNALMTIPMVRVRRTTAIRRVWRRSSVSPLHRLQPSNIVNNLVLLLFLP